MGIATEAALDPQRLLNLLPCCRHTESQASQATHAATGAAKGVLEFAGMCGCRLASSQCSGHADLSMTCCALPPPPPPLPPQPSQQTGGGGDGFEVQKYGDGRVALIGFPSGAHQCADWGRPGALPPCCPTKCIDTCLPIIPTFDQHLLPLSLVQWESPRY